MTIQDQPPFKKARDSTYQPDNSNQVTMRDDIDIREEVVTLANIQTEIILKNDQADVNDSLNSTTTQVANTIKPSQSSKDVSDDEDENENQAPRRLRRAETVLQSRTGRFILILDNVKESFSQQAMIRTAESLGIQYIYSIRSNSTNGRRRMCKSVMKGAKSWVTIHVFDSTEDCLQHLQNEQIELWSLVDSELGFEYSNALLETEDVIIEEVSDTTNQVQMSDNADEATNGTVSDNTSPILDIETGPFIPNSLPLPLEPVFFASHKYWSPADASIVDAVNPHVNHLPSYLKETILSHHEVLKKTTLSNSYFETFKSSIEEDAFIPTVPGFNKDIIIPAKTSIYGFPSRVAIVIGNENGEVNATLTQKAKRYVYIPTHGFTREGFTPSVRLAVLLDRLFMLCPEARGDLTVDEKIRVRESWFPNLAKSPTQKIQFEKWLHRWREIKPLQELRINDKKVPMLNKRMKKKLVILHNVPETHGLVHKG